MQSLAYLTVLFVIIQCISFFIRRIFNLQTDCLYCGLFGAVGKDGQKPNLAKIKILGIYNQSRGKDSCGYYYNDFIGKGTGYSNKEFMDYIKNVVINDDDVQNSVFIGHTRFATAGSEHSEKNAHPFIVDNNLVLAHNGVVDNNIYELCEKYVVDHADINVDSLALAHLLNKQGFSILDEYRGYAALSFTYREEPNVLYLYHGKSRLYEKGEPMEERPLFILESEEAFYYSSLKEALDVIRDSEKQIPKMLTHNMVFKIKDGHVIMDEAYKVNRENNNIGLEKKTNTGTNTSNITKAVQHLPFRSSMSGNGGGNSTAGTNSSVGKQVLPELDYLVKHQINVEKRETFPLKCFDEDLQNRDSVDFVFYMRGRYYHNDNELCQGVMYLNKRGIVYPEASYLNKVLPQYFHRGIKIKSLKDYEDVMKYVNDPDSVKIRDHTKNNFAFDMSKYSAFPITNLSGESLMFANAYRHVWYLGGKIQSRSYTPLFSQRAYIFNKGVLISIVPTDKVKDIPLADNLYINAPKGYDIPVNSADVDDEDPVDDKTIYIDSIPLYDKNNRIEKINHVKEIESMRSQFEDVFTDMEELEANCSPEVLRALDFYHADMLDIKEMDCKDKEQTRRLDKERMEFIFNSLNWQAPFCDLITTDIPFEQYLDMAIIESRFIDSYLEKKN